MNALQLAVGQRYIAALRHHYALTSELFFEAQSAESSAHAHQAWSIETDQEILRAVADGNCFRQNLRGKNIQSEVAGHASMNGAGVERDS